jgi:hypothetical protein
LKPLPKNDVDHGPELVVAETDAMRVLKEPTPASPRIATGGPPTPVLVTILMTPPTALSPYSTAPLLPRVISIRSIELSGMVDRSTPARSMSFTRRPLIRISVLAVANAPKPRISTVVPAPFTPPYRLVNCTPGTCAMTSCTVCPGECAMSSAVITVEDAPTMPANCRPPLPSLPDDVDGGAFEPVPGAGLGLFAGVVLGAGRRGPALSS